MPYSVLLPCISGVGVLDGILYAVGGHDGPLVRKSVESYNPDTKTWTPVADMALCRRNAGMCSIFVSVIMNQVCEVLRVGMPSDFIGLNEVIVISVFVINCSLNF